MGDEGEIGRSGVPALLLERLLALLLFLLVLAVWGEEGVSSCRGWTTVIPGMSMGRIYGAKRREEGGRKGGMEGGREGEGRRFARN